MLKRFFTSEGWLRNRLLYKLGFAYALALGVVCVSSFAKHPLFPLSLDTVRAILSTVMGVSGSILGFLVIYLTLALESIRRYFGRHAINIFRHDPVIWILCVFFSYIIIISLVAFCAVDLQGWLLTFLFNLSCVSFLLGIGLIVPMGIIILNRTDTAIRIKYLLDSIEVMDFRPRPQNDVFFGTSYWIITEDPGNAVDRFTALLLHNIGEGNNRIVASMLRTFYARIELILEGDKVEGDIQEVVMRFYDILSMAFDQVKKSGDEAIIKLIFAGLNAGSVLAAQKLLGPVVIDYIFKSARTMIQYLMEHENEQLTFEGLWRYYHMVRSEVELNFPSAYDKGKFRAFKSMMAFDYDDLIDRAFNCSNKYITENAVRMHVVLLDVLIRDVSGFPEEKSDIAKMMSYHAANHIIKWADNQKVSPLGFLGLFLHGDGLLMALKEGTSLTLAVVMDYCRVGHYLLESGNYVEYDLRDIGELGRLIITNAPEIKEVDRVMNHVLSLNKTIWLRIRELIAVPANKKDSERLEQELKVLEEDIANWLKLYYSLGLNIPALEHVIQIFQVRPRPGQPPPPPPPAAPGAPTPPAPPPAPPGA